MEMNLTTEELIRLIPTGTTLIVGGILIIRNYLTIKKMEQEASKRAKDRDDKVLIRAKEEDIKREKLMDLFEQQIKEIKELYKLNKL